MDEVQVEQQNYQMPPVEGFTVAHFLTVTDLKRSAEFYKTVFDGEIVSMGDGNAPLVQIAVKRLVAEIDPSFNLVCLIGLLVSSKIKIKSKADHSHE